MGCVTKVCLPKALNLELEASELRGLEKDVILQIVDGCLRSREFSCPLNVQITRAAIGRRPADRVLDYLKTSPYFQAASGASFVPGAACRRYEVLCEREGNIDPAESSLAADGGGRWVGDVVYRLIDFEELNTKRQAALAESVCGKSIEDAFFGLKHCDVIELSDDEIIKGATEQFLAGKPDSTRAKIKEVCECHLAIYHRYAENRMGEIVRKNGRTYSPVTSLPRWMRRLIVRFKGESATVDVSACYPWLLGAVHRQWLCRQDGVSTKQVDEYLEIIRGGQLYRRLAAEAGMPYETDSEQRAVKAQTQMFCLFGRIGRHPLWFALQEICPGVASYIRWWRSQSNGATRMAHRLQRLEGALMTDGIQKHMASQCIPCVQIHDAVIVPVQYGQLAEGWLRDYSRTLYGTECRVKVEIAV